MRLLLSFMIVMAAASLTLALTPKERVLVKHASDGVTAGIQTNQQLGTDLAQAKGEAAKSADSAATAATKAATAEAQAKTEHSQLQTCANQNAAMRPIVKEVQSWWGIGGIIYGFKRLAVHMLILTAALIAILVLVMVLAPAVIPFIREGFSMVIQFLTFLERVMASFWSSLFHGSTPPPAPAPNPTPAVSEPVVQPPPAIVTETARVAAPKKRYAHKTTSKKKKRPSSPRRRPRAGSRRHAAPRSRRHSHRK